MNWRNETHSFKWYSLSWGIDHGSGECCLTFSPKWCPVMDWCSIQGVFLLHTQCFSEVSSDPPQPQSGYWRWTSEWMKSDLAQVSSWYTHGMPAPSHSSMLILSGESNESKSARQLSSPSIWTRQLKAGKKDTKRYAFCCLSFVPFNIRFLWKHGSLTKI